MDLSRETFKGLLAPFCKELYRADQVFAWLYGKEIRSFFDMTNLPHSLQIQLSRQYEISTLNVTNILISLDGTQKFVFVLKDGSLIESVLLFDKEKATLCVSTQVGCAMGCRFCLTGKMGFVRNLSPSEIVGQILVAQKLQTDTKKITNLVFMGMGEPLLNYAHTVTAIRIITDSLGLNISPRRITVSTCGIAYKIVQFGHELSVNLAISLNAPSDELRSYLMPVNKKYPLSVLIEACKKFPLQKRKRITFEYIMLSGINDTQSHAQELLHTIRGIRCKVNLIPFNEYYGSEFKQSHSKTIKKFQEVLMDGHITASIRKSRGADIMASCGQLTFKNV